MTTRKRFSKQFKLQAVELLEQSDKPATDVARELGVMRNQLCKWQHELKSKGEDKAFRGPGRTAATEERSEVAELRRRLAQLEEENALLRRASPRSCREAADPGPGLAFCLNARWSKQKTRPEHPSLIFKSFLSCRHSRDRPPASSR